MIWFVWFVYACVGIGIGIYSIIFLCLFRRLVIALENMSKSSNHVVLGSAQHDEDKGIQERTVGELPPEIVAPHIKKPPRAKGGFGSKVDLDEKSN